jgi:threonine synthase
MDVGAPSNFIRIQELFDNDIEKLRQHLSGYSYTDDQTRLALEQLFSEKKYIADPHGAIGYLALKEYLGDQKDVLGVFLETAHPVKFLDVIPTEVAKHISISPEIETLLTRVKKSKHIATYAELKTYLLE